MTDIHRHPMRMNENASKVMLHLLTHASCSQMPPLSLWLLTTFHLHPSCLLPSPPVSVSPSRSVSQLPALTQTHTHTQTHTQTHTHTHTHRHTHTHTHTQTHADTHTQTHTHRHTHTTRRHT